jgi:hypothetical protein
MTAGDAPDRRPFLDPRPVAASVEPATDSEAGCSHAARTGKLQFSCACRAHDPVSRTPHGLKLARHRPGPWPPPGPSGSRIRRRFASGRGTIAAYFTF